MISNILSGLKIKCDYSHRGCQEYIRLEELDSHVKNSGFAPVKCSNEECEIIVNKREIIHHESTVCGYRKVKCHNCVKIEQDVEEMNEKMEQKFDEVNKRMEKMTADVDGVRRLTAQMFHKLCFLENAIQTSPAVNYASSTFVEDILVVGGFDIQRKRLKSVERFSFKKNVWDRVSSINVTRVGATSFVYENQVFVAGGYDSPLVDVLNLNEDPLNWKISKTTLPFTCHLLRSVVYPNRAVFFCACGKSDRYAELCLNYPTLHM